jgi:hypothetical protein
MPNADSRRSPPALPELPLALRLLRRRMAGVSRAPATGPDWSDTHFDPPEEAKMRRIFDAFGCISGIMRRSGTAEVGGLSRPTGGNTWRRYVLV